MSCTCAKKQYPCPVHAPGHLPVPDVVEHHCIVVRIYQRLGTDEKWFSTITKDAIQVSTSMAFDAKKEAVSAAGQSLIVGI